MSSFAILVKTYAADLSYVNRLMDSVHRYNVDHVPVFVVAPDDELALFAHLECPGVSVLPESMFGDHLSDRDINGYRAGYINQAIIKLCFWETGLAENYLCVDSDAEFIRPFYMSDFMHDASTPFTFLTEDAELRSEPEYHADQWEYREAKLREIMRAVGLDSPRLLTVHGHAVFSATVLRSFRDQFLAPRHWGYLDALTLSPYEPTWYNMWLQKDGTIPIVMREPMFKTFHNPSQHLEYVLRGVTVPDIARGYVATVVNSNYSRGDGVAGVDDARAVSLASYVTVPDLIKAAAYSTWWRVTFHGAFWSGLRHRVGAILGRGPRPG